jgi:hypothetical protein
MPFNSWTNPLNKSLITGRAAFQSDAKSRIYSDTAGAAGTRVSSDGTDSWQDQPVNLEGMDERTSELLKKELLKVKPRLADQVPKLNAQVDPLPSNQEILSKASSVELMRKRANLAHLIANALTAGNISPDTELNSDVFRYGLHEKVKKDIPMQVESTSNIAGSKETGKDNKMPSEDPSRSSIADVYKATMGKSATPIPMTPGLTASEGEELLSEGDVINERERNIKPAARARTNTDLLTDRMRAPKPTVGQRKVASVFWLLF